MPRRSAPAAITARPSLVLAREPLASLVELVMRHVDGESLSAASAVDARQQLEQRPGTFIADLTIPGAMEVLEDAARDHVLTIALIDLEAGGSSFTAFARGADQVVRIPFTPDELAVRVAALRRRSGHQGAFRRANLIDGFELNLDERVRIGSNTISLDPTLNSLLYLLAARAGRSIEFEDVRRLAWGIDRRGTDDAIARRLAMLARKLGARTLSLDIDVPKATATLHERSSHEPTA